MRHILLTCEVKRGRNRMSSGAADSDSEHLDLAVLGDVRRALEGLGCIVTVVEGSEALLHMYPDQDCDGCINLSVGYGGPSTKVLTAALLEILDIPYLGSPPNALAITRDKCVMKALAKAHGIATPQWRRVDIGDNLAFADHVPRPVIVKPLYESCSIGIDESSIASSAAAIRQCVDRIWQEYDQPALIETYIPGIDLEVPLLGHPTLRALGCVGVVPSAQCGGADILTSAMVYRDAYAFVAPADVVPTWSEVTERNVLAASLELAKSAWIRDYGRIDYRVGIDGTVWFIEASTHPYLARRSGFCWLTQQRGCEYQDLWRDLLHTVEARFARGRRRASRG